MSRKRAATVKVPPVAPAKAGPRPRPWYYLTRQAGSDGRLGPWVTVWAEAPARTAAGWSSPSLVSGWYTVEQLAGCLPGLTIPETDRECIRFPGERAHAALVAFFDERLGPAPAAQLT